MIFCIAISMFSDSSSEMFGTRSAFGESVPSAISGIKAVPRNGNRDSVPANSRMTETTLTALC